MMKDCKVVLGRVLYLSNRGYLPRYLPYPSRGQGRVDIPTHPYTTAACAAGVVTRTADRDSSSYRYSGIRRTRQLALGCEGN